MQALAFIAADEDMLRRFLAETGALPERIAERSADPAFLGGVLDFVLADDSRALAFAASIDLAPENLALVRARLPGGGREW